MSTAKELYKEGNLKGALDKILDEVRENPTSVSKRAFLIELLCFSGDWERADRQLDTMLSLDEKSALTVGTWRQLIRAAQTRDDVYFNGATPDVIEQPTERIQIALKLLLAQRENQTADCETLLEQLNNLIPQKTFSVNDITALEWRDLDDVTNGIVELLGTNGKYFWVDCDQIESIEFHAPARPLDLLWRKATVSLCNGTTGDVFVPAIYPQANSEDDELKLGRKTDWLEGNGIVRGAGLRSLLVGEEAVSIMDIKSITTVSAVEAIA